ncbi:hypothetical protein E2C01_050166 [Portunus trituberculatus]|uniref:Uncharacterized protein n=1 Tax=Portunus trituberculatus TaxID=210409 RepID=A0A5B7GFT1_PORTR|nr:hypothetical protein [Portunus trituberculatus]
MGLRKLRDPNKSDAAGNTCVTLGLCCWPVPVLWVTQESLLLPGAPQHSSCDKRDHIKSFHSHLCNDNSPASQLTAPPPPKPHLTKPSTTITTATTASPHRSVFTILTHHSPSLAQPRSIITPLHHSHPAAHPRASPATTRLYPVASSRGERRAVEEAACAGRGAQNRGPGG